MITHQYSNVGFCKYKILIILCLSSYCLDKAPVSKALLVYVGSSHAATLIPSFTPFFRKIFTGDWRELFYYYAELLPL